MTPDLRHFASALDSAARRVQATDQITTACPALTVDEAYDIQQLGIGLRLARSERAIGIKLGFTSRAKMLQMGVSDLIGGRLTDAMQLCDGASLSHASFIHPRVEPEIAFVLRRPLGGRATAFEATGAIEYVAPALEIIDSRYRDFKFNVADVIADNSSASAFVLGAPKLYGEDLSNLGILLSINGRAVQGGSSAAILGHPLRALVEGARLAALRGDGLKAGDIVLAGAATAAEPCRARDYIQADVERLGRVSCCFN